MPGPKKKITVKKKKKAEPKKPLPTDTSQLPDPIALTKKRLVRASDAKSSTDNRLTSTGTIKASRTTPVVDPGQQKKFKFYCVWCAQKLSAYEYWSGRELPCPSCKSVITIPEYPGRKAGR